MAESSNTSGTGCFIRENCTAIDGVRHAQIETAHLLHLCFLAARDHPIISKVMPELIAGAFDAIRTIAGQMHSEAEVIIKRHEKEQLHVQSAMPDVGTECVQLKHLDELREHKKLKKEREKSEADRSVQRMEKVKTKMRQHQEEMRILEYKKTQLDAVHEVETLTLEEDNAADVPDLISAGEGLAQVYDQLLRCNEYWRQIAISIHLINLDTESAGYMPTARPDILKRKVQQLEWNWKTFIAACDKYVSVCKHDDSESVRKLYRFLSEPEDSMTKAERRKRQADIAEELKRRIADLGDE